MAMYHHLLNFFKAEIRLQVWHWLPRLVGELRSVTKEEWGPPLRGYLEIIHRLTAVTTENAEQYLDVRIKVHSPR